MAQLAEEWLQEMGIGLANTQYVIARHFDKKHPHCHLVFNRIANDGSVISDSKERIRNEAACRQIKKRHGLTFGNSQSRKINPDRLRRYEAEKLLIRQLVLNRLSQSKDWKTFAQLLAQDGITLSFSTDSNTGRIRGVSYEHNGFRISGSKLGLHNQFTYGSLSKQLGSMDTTPSIANQPGIVKERNVIYIPVIRYIEILTNLTKIPTGRGDNREWEVGRRGRKWERIDDRIEEETTSYKFKM